MTIASNPTAPTREHGGVRRVVEADCAAVWLWGEHDLSTMPAIASALVSAAQGGEQNIAVDLRELTFMDASTISCLVDGRRLLEGSQTRQLHVRQPSGPARQLLELLGLSDLIQADGDRRIRASALESWVDVPPSAPGSVGRKADRSVR